MPQKERQFRVEAQRTYAQNILNIQPLLKNQVRSFLEWLFGDKNSIELQCSIQCCQKQLHRNALLWHKINLETKGVVEQWQFILVCTIYRIFMELGNKT
jgi:hypothetical protein